MSSIVTLCLSAGIQKTISFNSLKTGAVNRSRSYIYDAAGKAVNSARVLTQLMKLDSENKAAAAFKTCASESTCKAGSDSKAADTFKTPAAPDDVTLICPLGKKNADFFQQLAAHDGLNPEAVLIPGYTRECCTLLDDATGEVTELVVEEPSPEGDAPVSDLLFTLRSALARASAFSKLEDSGAVACKAGIDNQASAAFKAAGGSASVSGVDDKASVSCKTAGALPRTALLFAGSRPAFWPKDVITQIALAAKKAGTLFMADFRGDDLLSLLDTPALTPDIIKINEAEFRETFMRGNFDDSATGFEKTYSAAATSAGKAAGYAECTDDTDSLAAAICEKSRVLGNIIVVTRGADSTLAADHGTLYECASEKVHAVNTIGCGDSFNAGFLYEYMTGGDVARALEKGTWCAARNAERLSPGKIH